MITNKGHYMLYTSQCKGGNTDEEEGGIIKPDSAASIEYVTFFGKIRKN